MGSRLTIRHAVEITTGVLARRIHPPAWACWVRQAIPASKQGVAAGDAVGVSPLALELLQLVLEGGSSGLTCDRVAAWRLRGVVQPLHLGSPPLPRYRGHVALDMRQEAD